VAKVVEAESSKKMLIAGANAVVSPNIIGGRRMASELVRPDVTEFLDQMMRDRDRNLRLEEVLIPVNSSFAGKLLRDVPFRSEANVLVVAVRDSKGAYVYNPSSDFQLDGGAILIVLGETKGELLT
jgi:voltage-gated potassium channel